MVEKFVILVDAQETVDGGKQIVGIELVVFRIRTIGRCGTDDLPHLHAATGDEDRHRAGPVIATGLHDFGTSPFLRVDAGRTTEFA